MLCVLQERRNCAVIYLFDCRPHFGVVFQEPQAVHVASAEQLRLEVRFGASYRSDAAGGRSSASPPTHNRPLTYLSATHHLFWQSIRLFCLPEHRRTRRCQSAGERRPRLWPECIPVRVRGVACVGVDMVYPGAMVPRSDK